MSKEYVFTLEVAGEDVLWKCVVGETECVTYEGDVECKHLKITNSQKKQGVLMIDTVTKVYDEILPFQLENGIPYIKVDGRWIASDTTKEDRLQAKIKSYKKQAYGMCGLGTVLLVYTLIRFLVTGSLGAWDLSPVMGIFCFASAGMTLVRLKNELEAMGRKFTLKL